MASAEPHDQAVLPWAVNMLFVVIGVQCVFNVLRTLCLFISAEFKSINLSRYGVGSWAVVTGSTDGIGKAFAEELARQGFNIYQISRDSAKLKACQEALMSTHKVQVISRVWDFCSTDFKTLVTHIGHDLAGKDVSFLVNNVGIFKRGPLHQMTHADISSSLNVNCFAQVYVTRAVLPRLQDRQQPSAVINLSSMAGQAPLSERPVYSATKGFTTSFTVNLASSPGSVTYLDLCPYYTVSAMTARVGYCPVLITAKECAEAALRDLGSNLSFAGHRRHKAEYAVMSWLPLALREKASVLRLVGRILEHVV
jgi:17beta-estradiol 17-dehydrogenase / very-long-chain 3-oxoacyl-CoA reductase